MKILMQETNLNFNCIAAELYIFTALGPLTAGLLGKIIQTSIRPFANFHNIYKTSAIDKYHI